MSECVFVVYLTKVYIVSGDRPLSAKGMIYYNIAILTFHYYDKYVHNIVVVFFFISSTPSASMHIDLEYTVYTQNFFVCSPCRGPVRRLQHTSKNLYDFISCSIMDVDDDHIVMTLYYSLERKSFTLFICIHSFVCKDDIVIRFAFVTSHQVGQTRNLNIKYIP